jgi:hypothetical protein
MTHNKENNTHLYRFDAFDAAKISPPDTSGDFTFFAAGMFPLWVFVILYII